MLLRPDLEEELSRASIGDVPGAPDRRASRRLALGLDAQAARAPTVRNIAEYLAHERARSGAARTKASSSCAAWTRCARTWTALEARLELLTRARRGVSSVKLRVLARLIEIQRVLLRHGLDDFVRATHLYRPLRFLFFLSPGIWFERRRRAQPRRAAAAGAARSSGRSS